MKKNAKLSILIMSSNSEGMIIGIEEILCLVLDSHTAFTAKDNFYKYLRQSGT